MCGICGIVDFSGKGIELPRLEAMTEILAHRGPDDRGIYNDGTAGLGHRRLAIIDLTPAGHQPMSNESGTVWVVYNGEIYNYRELRSELISRGHRFRSTSDTEVIIHGYEEWHDGCWERMDGMFASALWDSRAGKLFLARGPFGIKPLYYWRDGDKVVFASEIKSVLASGLVNRELNLPVLSDYLSYFYTPGPETILKNIFHVKPGRITAFTRDGQTERRFWRIKEDDSLADIKLRDLADMVRRECRIAVEKALIADVPVGLLLSGGIDSNIILDELLAAGYPDIQAVTVGFRHRSFDETAAVKKRVAGLKLTNHIIYEEDHDIPAVFDRMVYHLDSLNANFANLALYFIFKAAVEHVKVALLGSGNDELYAGYITYLADRIRPRYNLLPGFIRDRIRLLAHRMPQTARKYSADYLLRKFTEGAAYPSEKSHYWWRTIFTDEDKRRLFASGEAAWQKDSFLVYKAFYDDAPAGWSFTDKSLYADFFLFCNENANMMMDNLSMSFSLELRPPFLTKRFVEFAFKVPYRFKLKGAATKYCLRKAYEGRLPRHIVAGKKSGLVSPVSQLIQGPLKDAVRDTFAASARLNYFNKPYLDRMLAEHLAGRQDHGYQIYLIFTFMRWHSIFMEGGLPASSIRGAL